MKAGNNFLQKLPKPFFVLAPMADVTDSAFRALIAKYGKPDVMWKEFVSADGLCLAPLAGKKKLLKSFEFTETERPIVAQIFGSKPENIEKASRMIADLGFDGVDINMGCPDKTIEKQCAGASLIKNPKLAKEIIQAAKRGATSGKNKIAVSVKTRIGFNKVELESWIPAILEENIDALTVHARTRKEMSLVPANWDYIKRAVEIRNEMKKDTLIIGNGDVKNIEEGIQRIKETSCDGVMIGRGIFGTPWLFSELKGKKITPSIPEKLKILIEHTKLFDKKLTGFKNFSVMKKHFKAYVNEFIGAKELREKLMQTENSKEVQKIIKDFLGNKGSIDR
ncbi:MAG: tRNA-dihydrouridine synthase [bacterium]